MSKFKKLELLSPAKNLKIGIAAINAGADAVYIGASDFTARQNAKNHIDDIKELIEYAHKFNVKVYVTLNTILYDHELNEAEKLIWEIYEAKADGIIIQDMGILKMNLPPMRMIASTQCDNRSKEKVKFFEKLGFEKVVLARELNLEQIKEISENTNIQLEFFIHGALCVSYSGQCYFSQAFCNRSSNRGQCAQMCRMKYSLIDSEDKIIVKDKYLLSLKDLNSSENLKDLIDAGITSFKIEGRLKDEAYVVNTTLFYRKALDEIISENQNFRKSSSGEIYTEIKPDLQKSFNRAFTDYFLKKRSNQIAAINSPKSIGEFIGEVEKVRDKYFVIKHIQGDKIPNLNNGDGVCLFDKDGNLVGTKISTSHSEKVYPYDNEIFYEGCKIYRNFDIKFEKEILNNPPKRRIHVNMFFSISDKNFEIKAQDQDGNTAIINFENKQEEAKNKEKAYQNIIKQLKKSGESIFEVENVAVENFDEYKSFDYFIPISDLNKARRELLLKLEKERIERYTVETGHCPVPTENTDYIDKKDFKRNFEANVSNHLARKFYEEHGIEIKEDAFELQKDIKNKRLMTTKYCLGFEFGFCAKNKRDFNLEKFKPPFYLQDQKGNKHLLKFDCKNCEMNLF